LPLKILNLSSVKFDVPSMAGTAQAKSGAPNFRRNSALESVEQTKTWSFGNARAARRAFAGFWNIPNTAEPLPASEAPAAPCRSNSRLIAASWEYREKTAASKSFERAPPCGLQHRAQNRHSLGVF